MKVLGIVFGCVLYVVVLTNAQLSTHTCAKPNQEFLECGTACPKKCNSPDALFCTEQCVQGCFCKAGFVLDDAGNCVPPAHCNGAGGHASTTTTSPTNKCKVNEAFNECGSACEPSCTKPTPDICPAVCVAACQCKDGFLRNEKGECVLPGQCTNNSTSCSQPNEVFSSCKTPCEPSCENKQPSFCAAACFAGCQCQKGFFRRTDGACVTEANCPIGGKTTPSGPVSGPTAAPGKCVDPNAAFVRCGTACPATCRQQAPRVCTKQCVVGCQCKLGYVKDDNDKCVLTSQCSKLNDTTGGVKTPTQQCKDPSREEFSNCASACEPSCQKPNPEICTMQCIVGCHCKKGFLQDGTGKCVLPSECPKSPSKCTGVNEEANDCAYPCQPTCNNPYPNCDAECTPGCNCKAGFIRNDHGNCTDVKQCPKRTCPVNEVWSNECAPPLRCQHGCPNMPQIMCKLAYCAPGCLCKDGFLRNEAGQCVAVANCGKTPITPPPVLPASVPAGPASG